MCVEEIKTLGVPRGVVEEVELLAGQDIRTVNAKAKTKYVSSPDPARQGNQAATQRGEGRANGGRGSEHCGTITQVDPNLAPMRWLLADGLAADKARVLR